MVESKGLEDRAKDPKNISFTADYHTYFKLFYGLPFANEICDFSHGQEAFEAMAGGNVASNLSLIPIFEARYKGTDAAIRKYIEMKGIRQVLSLAAGMEPRGIAFADKYSDMVYVETDISGMFENKSALADSIFSRHKLKNRGGLHFHVANALISEQLEEALVHFSPNKPLIIVNEGLLAYYSEKDNRVIMQNVHNILSRFGGVWITSDTSLNRENRKILFSHVANIKQTTAKVEKGTGRNYDEKGFVDNEHAEKLLTSEGFNIREYGQDELGYHLNSLDKVGLDKTTFEQVAGNIRQHVKAWAMSI